MASEERKLRIGVAGLGRAFTVMLPTFTTDPRVALVAAADPRPEARARFAADFPARIYATVEALCADPDVEIVYVATPHQYHAQHAMLAAGHGKHVLVEKPMAVALGDCAAMIAAAQQAGVHLIVGHSHSFDRPILRTRELLASYGPISMIHALNYTDFILRPRRPEELDTAQGGGVVFNQAAHQVDIVRLLGGGLVKSVRAQVAHSDLRMIYLTAPADSGYSALLTFESGIFASLVYGGYGHFDSDEFSEWIGEMGQVKDTDSRLRRPQPNFTSADDEAAYKAARSYGGASYQPSAAHAIAHQHFGTVIVSCQHADLQPLPTGVKIHSYGHTQIDRLAQPAVPRGEVIDEVFDAVVSNKPPLHDGAWAMATLEVCLAILQSSREDREVVLTRQVAAP
jgi:phthalate 4,5-cis-dihydrodiol dehydrogenase